MSVCIIMELERHWLRYVPSIGFFEDGVLSERLFIDVLFVEELKDVITECQILHHYHIFVSVKNPPIHSHWG